MSKIFVPVTLLIALAATAHAQNFGYPSYQSLRAFPVRTATGGPVLEDQVIAGTPADIHGGLKGYPFVGGCCDEVNPCCSNLWDGYCGARRFGHHLRGWHQAGRMCAVDACGCGMGGYAVQKGSVAGGCGCGVPTCGGCGYGRGAWLGLGACRPGLFRGLHHRHGMGCGCDMCGGYDISFKGGYAGGCQSCGGGKHLDGHIYSAPAHEESRPTEELNRAPLPTPAVEAPPAPTSAPADHSARLPGYSTWRWTAAY